MNLSGGTSPKSGCCQRRSASNPVILPVAISICGWYIKKEFSFVECQSQAVLQGQSLHSLSVHLLREESKVVTPALFGAIHSRIGTPNEGFKVHAVFREDADADATANAEWAILNDELSGHCIHKPLSGNRCIG